MSTTRRGFLSTTMAGGAGLALPGLLGARFGFGQEAKPLKVLILGGTGFIGPHQVAALQQRGHAITLFNRGKTRPDLFDQGDGIEELVGDRDPDKDEGLAALEGRSFDAVIDNSGYYPRHVRASARLLADHAKQYIFVSSISVYADSSAEGGDETSKLATMPDPTQESMGQNYEYYGALKALCEQAAEEEMPGRVTIVRPGYIVGPGDTSHRFTTWPLRIEKGGEVAVPGTPSDPVQIIDARDLCDWIVHLAENGTTGIFNACGPKERLTMEAMVNACKEATESDATFTWLPQEFLLKHPDLRFQIWAPYEGESKGFHTWSNARAVEAGLTFRPLVDTVRATLRWFHTDLPEQQRERLLQRIPNPKEAEALREWHESQGG